MRPNSRNWPAWVFAVATAWLVVIVVAWAIRPLVDRVPTTVAHIAQPADRPETPKRDNGGVVKVTCGSPASATAVDPARLPLLKVDLGQTLSRAPCAGYHSQSRRLFFANLALYAVCVGGLGFVLARRRRERRAGTLAVT